MGRLRRARGPRAGGAILARQQWLHGARAAAGLPVLSEGVLHLRGQVLVPAPAAVGERPQGARLCRPVAARRAGVGARGHPLRRDRPRHRAESVLQMHASSRYRTNALASRGQQRGAGRLGGRVGPTGRGRPPLGGGPVDVRGADGAAARCFHLLPSSHGRARVPPRGAAGLQASGGARVPRLHLGPAARRLRPSSRAGAGGAPPDRGAVAAAPPCACIAQHPSGLRHRLCRRLAPFPIATGRTPAVLHVRRAGWRGPPFLHVPATRVRRPGERRRGPGRVRQRHLWLAGAPLPALHARPLGRRQQPLLRVRHAAAPAAGPSGLPRGAPRALHRRQPAVPGGPRAARWLRHLAAQRLV
mmetsp:Transcript_65341/g.181250  ORF Transcript_65341/g.181250 Transcript_65341/m.181250 type:complete len:358 (-) Transcript_65341:605-1678(-)